LKEEFISSVQQRGTAGIKARGLSSAGSAANAIVDTVRFLTNDTPRDDWHSVAVCSDGSYGVEKDLISSFPVRTRTGKWEIVQNIPINEFSRTKIDASLAELKEEKSLVGELLRYSCHFRYNNLDHSTFVERGFRILSPRLASLRTLSKDNSSQSRLRCFVVRISGFTCVIAATVIAYELLLHSYIS
jgi:hypothetical protein